MTFGPLFLSSERTLVREGSAFSTAEIPLSLCHPEQAERVEEPGFWSLFRMLFSHAAQAIYSRHPTSPVVTLVFLVRRFFLHPLPPAH